VTAKILLLDCETAPAKVYTWGLYDQNIGINQIVDDGYVLCWCAKWLGEKEVMSDALINHTETFTKNRRDDSQIAKSIWCLLGEADIVVTHNGNDFDLKWMNTIFVKNGLKPQTGYKSVDTFIEVKKKFRFISNKLDFICRKLELGQKISTGGFELWEECMRGVKSSWAKMVRYCKHDVLLLEKLYRTIRPFITHPNMTLYQDGELACPNCAKKNFIKRGFHYSGTAKFQRFVCNVCGRYFTDTTKKITSTKIRSV
jgi:hypothetical protein